ncbi:MAG: hypothetical protein WAO76_12745 [Georgfuchsia sp.]
MEQTSLKRSIFDWIKLAALGFSIAILAACGSDGSNGSTGPQGPQGDAGTPADPAVLDDLQAQITALAQAVNPEQCSLCHAGNAPIARSGPMHQAVYKEFYQDGVMKVEQGSMNFSVVGTTATLMFKLTKNGAPFDCTKAVYNATTNPGGDFAIGSYWSQYDSATKTFPSDQSLVGTKAYDGVSGICTFTKTGLSAATATNMAGDGIVQIYGVDEILEVEGHLTKGKYPFAGVMKVGTVDYSTGANVSGCENCHTQPFLKHAYIYGKVLENVTGATTEFYTCKGCHYDNRDGHDFDWQIEKDNPAREAELVALAAAAAAAGDTAHDSTTENMTAEELADYAYKAKLMNDVHMSHNMEFAYPQSMMNCTTCHAGKLDAVLIDANFKPETCISCHSVQGIKDKMAAANYNHSSIIATTATLRATDCSAACHTAGGGAPVFADVHSGYDSKIYATDGTRYSDTFVVSINSVTVANNVLDIKFSATGTLGSIDAQNINPTILIGLYGYNTKDFIVAAHGTDADGKRNLEYVVGGSTRNPARIQTVSATGGSWEITADLSNWADKIADGSIKRAEIAVLPELKDADGTVLGLNAPSKTFNLDGVTDDSAYFNDIVKVFKTTGADGSITGCNTCHDQLATTFHSGIRGGNIKVCRICHEVQNGGSHLELQSRSIDSYVHAIHSFQAFDIGDVDFADAVESAEYVHHIDSSFPRFGILNCESCHNTGKYDVPDQSRSMPGVLSGTDAVAGRNIGAIPAMVTGPAVRACGGCHRAQAINADDANQLAALQSHWKTFGYAVDASSNASDIWAAVVAKVMAFF